ncbi:MAG: DUF1549 domain-containing protein [Acidobacteria bacterium]|nr:DUF1549 domain-containing protein [Acidobacteriota bacterium]
MRRAVPTSLLCRALGLLALLSPAGSPWVRAQQPEDDPAAFFRQQVRPILETRCFGCHGGQPTVQAGLRLTSREAMLQGGRQGPAVDPEDPASSLLIRAIEYAGPKMPPGGPLPPEQVAVLTRWVEQGAPWSEEQPEQPEIAGQEESAGPPGGEENGRSPRVEEGRNFWSFQPPRRPHLPGVERAEWVRTPIDAFVLARLEAAGLEPSPPAAKRVLLRRAYYDLTGLPPTPKDVEAFLADTSPGAFARVVDRLLASPQYGERWARHWLDLVRYAETNSYERDGPKPLVWRYRDYVISAFSEDKPYDRFILEQLAGDELEPAVPENIIATGFYRLGLWQDEPVDPVQELYEDLDDIVATTSQVFLGLTLNCARCHDHKLDPLPQRDYYRFLAFFHGVKRYGVRKPETVAEASLCDIGPPREPRRRLEAGWRGQIFRRQSAPVLRQLEKIEKLVAEDLTDEEKEAFLQEENRPGILATRVPRLVSDVQLEDYAEYRKRLEWMREAAAKEDLQALCVTEVGPEPRETFVLARGSHRGRRERVEPGFPAVLSPPRPRLDPAPGDGKTSGRRLALARWIAGPGNPLTARVMVNRVWQHHFGQGLVRTPNDFGFRGAAPTHPGLLDWLAVEWIRSDWRLKPVHRMILLSSAYRMASGSREKALALDPENRLLWRFGMRRLAAEEVRDSVLAVNGSLNLTMTGPGIYPVIPEEVLAGQSVPGQNWWVSSPQDLTRRSIYVHTKRSLIVPLIAAFDGADPDATCPVRFSTTQPTQALHTLNGEFMNRQARVLAGFVREEGGGDPVVEVRLALSRVLQRAPTGPEVARGVDLMESLRQNHRTDRDRALELFCLVALNLNEFIYLD